MWKALFTYIWLDIHLHSTSKNKYWILYTILDLKNANPCLEYTMKAKSAFKLVDDQVPKSHLSVWRELPCGWYDRFSVLILCDWCQQLLLQPFLTIPHYRTDQEYIKHSCFSHSLSVPCFRSLFLCSCPSSDNVHTHILSTSTFYVGSTLVII